MQSEEMASLSHSVVFLYFFALIAEEGFLISLCLGMFLLGFFLYLENSEMATGLENFTWERSTRLYVVTLLI